VQQLFRYLGALYIYVAFSSVANATESDIASCIIDYFANAGTLPSTPYDNYYGPNTDDYRYSWTETDYVTSSVEALLPESVQFNGSRYYVKYFDVSDSYIGMSFDDQQVLTLQMIKTGEIVPLGESQYQYGRQLCGFQSPVQSFSNIEFASYDSGETLLLNLWLPDDSNTSRKVILYVGGGGWTYGALAERSQFVGALLDRGFAVAMAENRGTVSHPGSVFPEQVQDVKAAIRWLRANGEQYNLDVEHIGALGTSSGAYNVAMLAANSGSPINYDLEGDGGNGTVSSNVSAVVALALPANHGEYNLGGTKSYELFLTGDKAVTPDADLLEIAAPVSHVNPDSAPILILHNQKDIVVDSRQSIDMMNRYVENSVHVELVMYPLRASPWDHAFYTKQSYFVEAFDRAKVFFDKWLAD